MTDTGDPVKDAGVLEAQQSRTEVEEAPKCLCKAKRTTSRALSPERADKCWPNHTTEARRGLDHGWNETAVPWLRAGGPASGQA